MTNQEAWLLVAVLLGAISFVVSAMAMYRALEASDALAQQLKTIEGAHKTASSALAHAVAVRNDCATLGKQLARDSADIAKHERAFGIVARLIAPILPKRKPDPALDAEIETLIQKLQDELPGHTLRIVPPTTSAIPPSPWKRGPSK